MGRDAGRESGNIEIERRFLVDPQKLANYGPPLYRNNKASEIEIEQGYIATGKVSVRVRAGLDRTIPEEYKPNRSFEITIKGPGTLFRAEVTIVISRRDGEALMNLAEYRIKKIRRLYQGTASDQTSLTWEVDEFLGPLKGLFLAEVELPDLDTVVEIPSFCLREVTEEKEYTNAALAKTARSLEKHHTDWLNREHR